MAKIGRNEPCPCGSGKKYKRCCAERDEVASRERARAAAAQASPEIYCSGCRRTHSMTAHGERFVPLEMLDELDDLDQLSNSVVGLIDNKRFDEARAACEELRKSYPDQIDWLDRTAMLYEAQGESKKAAEYYRKCLDFTYEHDGFEDESRVWMLEKIKKLDPEGPLPELRAQDHGAEA